MYIILYYFCSFDEINLYRTFCIRGLNNFIRIFIAQKASMFMVVELTHENWLKSSGYPVEKDNS